MHIGASNLIMGYLGYFLTLAFYDPNETTIALAVLSFYYFGGLLVGLVKAEADISWEGHFFGFVAGVICAYTLPDLLYTFG